MVGKLEQFCREYNLKHFYSIVQQNEQNITDADRMRDLIAMAPFIRQFSSKFVNYYGLKNILPIGDKNRFANRLEEFFSDLVEEVIKNGIDKSIPWMLTQKIDDATDFFPNRPVIEHYQDIMRGQTVLIELLKSIDPVSDETYDILFKYASTILKPSIDDDFESDAKNLIARLLSFDARKEGVESEKFDQLTLRIESMNARIPSALMTNNSFVSIGQQITDINKALKTIKKKTFLHLFPDKKSLDELWSLLKENGLNGGENYLFGDIDKARPDLEKQLEIHFRKEKTEILTLLENSFNPKELPVLEREVMPDAVHLYAINLLMVLGLRKDKAIKLVLGFHSRYVERSIRDSAHSALRNNSASVQRYFLRGVKSEDDYDQKLAIAEKHDTIFEKITAALLINAFGDHLRQEIEVLDTIIGPEGFLFGNFIKSSYMKLSDKDPKTHDTEIIEQKQINHFNFINSKLRDFKSFVENESPGVFNKLLKMWGLSYLVSWALADYHQEKRLFSFIIKAAEEHKVLAQSFKDQEIPLQDVINLLIREPDARVQIQKLMTFLLNSKISFDFPLFKSLFQVIAQRNQQLQGTVHIRDGFSEQRGYTSGRREPGISENIQFQDPYIFHPIVIFLITVLNMKAINIPKDAFVETDISLYLNSLAGVQRNPELGYQMYLAHELISSIPYIIDFASHHETIIRKTIADLDESYGRKNVLIHYHRIKIHRAPSKLDINLCLCILTGLSEKEPVIVLEDIKRLMKGIGDEAIPDMENYFAHYEEKLRTLGKHLKIFKERYQNTAWQEIAEDKNFTGVVRDIPGIDDESIKDIIALVKLVCALSNYWTRRINKSLFESIFLENELEQYNKSTPEEQLLIVRNKRQEYRAIINTFDPQLEPYQHIFLKRHVIQDDWNFDFFGFWPYYKETKFETYNIDRKLALLERNLLEQKQDRLSKEPIKADTLSEDVLIHLRRNITCLEQIMNHVVVEGLAPSKFFMDTMEVLQKDQLTLSQLKDILEILLYRELTHVDSFIANTYGHFPARITKALGRENLDFGLANLSAVDDELLFPLVQETVLGNIMAKAFPIHLLEKHLTLLLKSVSELVKIDPAKKIFPNQTRPYRALTPVFCGYKSYALQTLAQDGFNVPALITLPVNFFLDNAHLTKQNHLEEYKSELIRQILSLEQKTGKLFDLRREKLTREQWNVVETTRDTYNFNLETADKLMVSARSGSYRSMPGILGTVLNIGHRDIVKQDLASPELRFQLNVYRMFLSTFGNVVFGINEIEFSDIVSRHKTRVELLNRKVKWEDLSDDHILDITCDFKTLIEEHNSQLPAEEQLDLDWDDPLDLLAASTLGVWKSWDSEAAQKLRNFLGISADWKTAVIIMEMKQADKNPRSFSAILFSGDPQGKTNKPNGDVLFGRPGEDIAAGLASEGMPLETIETENPELYHQIADLLERIKINKGNVDVDVELVGEYDPATQKTDIFVIQERQMPLGAKGESEDFRLTPTDVLPLTAGKGVNGGVQYGVFLDGTRQEYHQLTRTVKDVREKLGEKDECHGPGIFLLMKYVTPEEALKMNIPGVDGVITTKIGKSSHASISAKRDGKLFICEAAITLKDDIWQINNRPVKLGNHDSYDIFTVVGNPKSVSPYSGNIYKGIMPLDKVSGRK
ncbi:hypothetical protein KKA14_19490 [bacterium]|nr:hypothetical protein [bacterium]